MGVAVVVGVDIARESARRAFLISTEAVTGRATHQVLGGPAGLPDSIYRVLRVHLGVRDAAPIVEGLVRAVESRRAMRVLGVDPFAEAPFRPYVGIAAGRVDIAAILTLPGAVLLSPRTAGELGLAVGDTFAVFAGGEPRTVHVAGTLEPSDELSRRALADLMLMDIAAAQELLGRTGVLDRIDLRIAGDTSGHALVERIDSALPVGVRLFEAESRTAATLGLARAFETNLSALSLVALVFGMFLIYNAATFSVVQRRPLIGLLRALGVTRAEILTIVLGEAALVGIAATTVGLVLGALLGSGLVGLVTRTINDLYFTVSVTGATAAPLTIVKGAILGVGATLLAAMPPAREAASTLPRVAMLRSMLEAGARRGVRRAALISLPLAATGVAILALAQRSLFASFVGLFLLIVAAALIAPAATVLMVSAIRPLVSAVFGTIGRMAARGVTGTLSRTGPAVAALSIAVAVGIAMGLLIDSFRDTVAAWLGQALVADVYVAVPESNSGHARLFPGLVERIEGMPGVDGVSTYRAVTLPLPDGELRLVAVRLFNGHREAFRLLDGDGDAAWTTFARGGVLVSEPLAYRQSLSVGDSLLVPTDRGAHFFPIAAVFRDYGTEHGMAFIDRATYDRFFDDEALGSVAVFARTGVDPDSLINGLRGLAGTEALTLRSNRAIREASLEVFDRTFAITIVLRALAMAVAFVGVLGALMSLQLEREREMGVLRALGLTPRQLNALVTSQTGILGLASGLLAIPLGIALAWTLIHVVNRRAFGWTMEMQIDARVLLQSLLLAVVAALIAGLYPGWRMGRMGVGEAVRTE